MKDFNKMNDNIIWSESLLNSTVCVFNANAKWFVFNLN